MITLTSKKSGRSQTISEEEYKEIADKGVIDLNKFKVESSKSISIIPALKQVPTEVKITKKTNK